MVPRWASQPVRVPSRLPGSQPIRVPSWLPGSQMVTMIRLEPGVYCRQKSLLLTSSDWARLVSMRRNLHFPHPCPLTLYTSHSKASDLGDSGSKGSLVPSAQGQKGAGPDLNNGVDTGERKSLGQGGPRKAGGCW